ncbi:MAG TPA: hypothetical protein VE263_20790 [Candidatus Angelobacter sp.]|nr:hypothetical protein [Candidatus Angelobacter sp.]
MNAKWLVFPGVLSCFLFNAPAEANWWKVQTSGIDSNLRAVSAVYVPNPKANGAPVPVVWVSGSKGVILRSLDEGKTWQRLRIADGDTLDFRGIVAFDVQTAYVMSIGEGDKSRIYKTIDGGETWKLQYSGDRKEVFLDTIACLSEKECMALGDPIDRKFLLLKTTDGEHWGPLPTDNMPAALPGEGAFAASNSCLAMSDDKKVFFGTGGPAARVFQSNDGGLTWTVARTPLVQGNPSSGIFALRADEHDRVLVVGGDYKETDSSDRVAATSLDNGKTWQLAAKQPGGFRSGLAQIANGGWVAVGPGGEDATEDYGAHWKHTDSLNLNAVQLLDTQTGWAVGDHGTIARFVNHFQYNVRVRPRKDARRPAASAIAD